MKTNMVCFGCSCILALDWSDQRRRSRIRVITEEAGEMETEMEHSDDRSQEERDSDRKSQEGSVRRFTVPSDAKAVRLQQQFREREFAIP